MSDELTPDQIAEMARGIDHACMTEMELENRKLRRERDAARAEVAGLLDTLRLLWSHTSHLFTTGGMMETMVRDALTQPAQDGEPCLDPDKMKGACDGFGGEDRP